MGGSTQILPGTGRWQRAALTEGALLPVWFSWRAPSTTTLRVAVPLPVPGRSG
jgi:hypothetical protein